MIRESQKLRARTILGIVKEFLLTPRQEVLFIMGLPSPILSKEAGRSELKSGLKELASKPYAKQRSPIGGPHSFQTNPPCTNLLGYSCKVRAIISS